MAGKAKKKLDYAGWSVDIFDNDTKIDKLLDAQGWTGFSVYFYLCQRAFGSEGYFYRWGYDDCASTARKMGCGISSGTIQEVVGYCLQIGLFHKGLFDRWGVLTSKGIQRSYWVVASTRRDKTVYKELWLLQSEECKGVVFVPIFNDMSDTNDHSQATNGDKLPTNEPVVKESKVKGSVKSVSSELKESPRQEAVYQLELIDGSYYGITRSDIEKYSRLYPAVDIDQEIRKMIGWLDGNPKNRKTPRGIGRFINGWLCRAQDSARPAKSDKPPAPNRFHNFEQRDMDYNALMMEQVQGWLGESGGGEHG